MSEPITDPTLASPTVASPAGTDTSGTDAAPPESRVSIEVNGRPRSATIEHRMTLADFLRESCGLTGTHLGCEHGVCGSCTVLVDGAAVRSCLLFAVQAQGRTVVTVEGLRGPDGGLTAVQEALRECHGLQCGFCTPGFVISATALLDAVPDPDDDQIRAALGGNLCRCTGYQGIIEAVRVAAGRRPRPERMPANEPSPTHKENRP